MGIENKLEKPNEQVNNEELIDVANHPGLYDTYAIYKELKETAPSVKEVEASIKEAKKLGYTIGKEVTLKSHTEVGKITGYNHETQGFYDGKRCPLIVAFPDIGTFEYETSSLTLVEN